MQGRQAQKTKSQRWGGWSCGGDHWAQILRPEFCTTWGWVRVWRTVSSLLPLSEGSY